MINYAKHDEEFYAIFKLISGEEIVSKALLSEDNGQTLIFLNKPVVIEFFTKELDEGKVAKGMGFSHWMQMSDEDFFIIEERNIVSLASLSKEYIVMYEAYLAGKNPSEIAAQTKIDLDPNMGYLGKIDDARRLFEKLYKNPSQP
tara:strand:+ start:227 stop:661 length:435 start_codon:yes stop_codon:yes gene_type:complete